MDDASKLKEQLYDITSQITIEPKDLQMNQKLTENQKNQKKIEDFSRRAKRVQFFEKAEQICNERHPDMQVKLVFFIIIYIIR